MQHIAVIFSPETGRFPTDGFYEPIPNKPSGQLEKGEKYWAAWPAVKKS
ncbi:hypothetical protein [Neisseria cinerea]|nr:hypothetical protein [Neisseria cinerea]